MTVMWTKQIYFVGYKCLFWTKTAQLFLRDRKMQNLDQDLQLQDQAIFTDVNLNQTGPHAKLTYSVNNKLLHKQICT